MQQIVPLPIARHMGRVLWSPVANVFVMRRTTRDIGKEAATALRAREASVAANVKPVAAQLRAFTGVVLLLVRACAMPTLPLASGQGSHVICVCPRQLKPTRGRTACNALPGFTGTACGSFCDAPLTCSGSGQCTASGVCECYNDDIQGHFSGSDCSDCKYGYLLPDCLMRVYIPTFVGCSLIYNVSFVSVSIDSTFTFLSFAVDTAGDGGSTSSAQSGLPTTDCRLYLAASTLGVLGTGPKCLWVTASLMRVELPNDNNITFQTTLSMKPYGVYGTREGNMTACSAPNVAVRLPLTLPPKLTPPQAVLNAREEVGRCEGVTLILSASLLASPRAKYEYGVATDAATNALRSILKKASSKRPTFVIPPSYLPVGKWVFIGTVTDLFTGLSSRDTINVTKYPDPIPSLEYSGQRAVTFRAAEGSALFVRGYFSPCVTNPPTSLLQYQWTIAPLPSRPHRHRLLHVGRPATCADSR